MSGHLGELTLTQHLPFEMVDEALTATVSGRVAQAHRGAGRYPHRDPTAAGLAQADQTAAARNLVAGAADVLVGAVAYGLPESLVPVRIKLASEGIALPPPAA